MISLAEKQKGNEKGVESVVSSFILAQKDEESMEKNLPHLKYFFKVRKIDLSDDQLREIIHKEKKKMEWPKAWAQRLGLMFSENGRPRNPRYRFSSPFCDSCGMYKNYQKECPYCGHFKITK